VTYEEAYTDFCDGGLPLRMQKDCRKHTGGSCNKSNDRRPVGYYKL